MLRKNHISSVIILTLLLGAALPAVALAGDTAAVTPVVNSLDGEWMLAPDPQNAGRENQWFKGPVPESKPAKVPWIIQDAFPKYHGVAWYWRTFDAPPNNYLNGRYLLRFWAVDYTAEVWVNGMAAGKHEGGESVFELDITQAVKKSEPNMLAVRVLNPIDEPIDGIVLNQTPHRNKVVNYWAGASFDQGGIMGSVELLALPPVYIKDLFVRADAATRQVKADVCVMNTLDASVNAEVNCSISPAREGRIIEVNGKLEDIPPGESSFQSVLTVPQPHRWDLNDPYLYRVTAQLKRDSVEDERSVRCGFRDFRFENGYFRLNGRRVFLRSSHTGNHCPFGLQLPHDPDIIRRDLLNVKTMGFNAIRFIAGVGTPYQLDLCDEIGLLVYEESYAGWCLENSPKMAERFDESVFGMVRRDRNHPSLVIWGLLNETPDGPVFRHAVETLAPLRALDDSRLVLLSSGRWDIQGSPAAGLEQWCCDNRPDPNIARNPTERVIRALGITWQSGQFSLHPGEQGQYSVLRWRAPAEGACAISAAFSSIAERATTDVHVLQQGKAVFDGLVNVDGSAGVAEYKGDITVAKGDAIDFAVGYGSGGYGGDTTALALTIAMADGQQFDPARDFSVSANPSGPWQYGYVEKEALSNVDAFRAYPKSETVGKGEAIGSLSNPGSAVWEDVLNDQHCYPRVPHTADVIRSLREYRGPSHSAGMGEGGFAPESGKVAGDLPVFLSEYGIGSAVDLVRVTRYYEQFGAEYLEDGQYYRTQLDSFLADWAQWDMASLFGRPEDYFTQCLAKMAGQRLLGFNAIRSNPNFVGFSLTGTVDQGMTGEGLTTTFREFKPGTIEAVFDGFAPLRWCMFAEPVNVYRGSKVRLEAVLADEDVLKPGDYPARIEVFGPGVLKVFEKQITVTIPASPQGAERPLALPVFSEEIAVDGPAGEYRLVAAFERGAAAAGGEATFYVADPAEMPAVDGEVVLCGADPELSAWLSAHGVTVRPFDAAKASEKQVLLISNPETAPQILEAVWSCVEKGSTAVVLRPEAFRKGDDPAGWLPLAHKGTVKNIHGWLYLKDEWAKPHPIFDGLPCGLMDYTYYREIIPDIVFSGQDALITAVAGGNKTSQGYDSGLLVSVHQYGQGRIVLNTLRIADQLGKHPAAEHLLRNMLRFAVEK